MDLDETLSEAEAEADRAALRRERDLYRDVADKATHLLLKVGFYGLHSSKREDLWGEARQMRNRFKSVLPREADRG